MHCTTRCEIPITGTQYVASPVAGKFAETVQVVQVHRRPRACMSRERCFARHRAWRLSSGRVGRIMAQIERRRRVIFTTAFTRHRAGPSNVADARGQYRASVGRPRFSVIHHAVVPVGLRLPGMRSCNVALFHRSYTRLAAVGGPVRCQRAGLSCYRGGHPRPGKSRRLISIRTAATYQPAAGLRALREGTQVRINRPSIRMNWKCAPGSWLQQGN